MSTALRYVAAAMVGTIFAVVGVATGCTDDKENSKKGGLSATDLDRMLEAGPSAPATSAATDAGDAGSSRPGWLRCQGGCSAKPGEVLECEKSTCTDNCDGECSGDSPVLCDGPCEGTCNGTPISGDICKGSCAGTCKHVGSPKTCPGLCTGRCGGICVLPAGEVICNGVCSGPSKPL